MNNGVSPSWELGWPSSHIHGADTSCKAHYKVHQKTLVSCYHAIIHRKKFY